jgi:hypothetical protein
MSHVGALTPGAKIDYRGSFAVNEIRRKIILGRKESLVTAVCILQRN